MRTCSFAKALSSNGRLYLLIKDLLPGSQCCFVAGLEAATQQRLYMLQYFLLHFSAYIMESDISSLHACLTLLLNLLWNSLHFSEKRVKVTVRSFPAYIIKSGLEPVWNPDRADINRGSDKFFEVQVRMLTTVICYFYAIYDLKVFNVFLDIIHDPAFI
jgi:hypothetical protein